MLRTVFTLAAVVVSSDLAWSQQPAGTPVGKPLVQPVGTQQPSVGTRLPSIGIQAPGYKPITSTDVIKQPQVDQKLLIGPFPTGVPSTGEKNVWDKLYDRWLDLFKPAPAKSTQTWTPGLSRRNRERNNPPFARD